MMITDTHVFFYGGPLSNFHWVGADSAKTSEQKFMLAKATIFNDREVFDKILAATSPRHCKSLGREIKNYDDEVWADSRYDAMMNALTWKYDACLLFRKALRECGDRIIVEASPIDRIWGIGYDETDAMSNQGSWGLNLLGRCPMQIKEENEL